MDLTDVDALVAKIAATLEDRPEVLEAYLFGSRARGAARPDSDVDVAVTLADRDRGSAGFGAASEIAADLMQALGTNAVDVVVLNGAPPVLHHRVLRDGIRVLSRDLAASTRREGEALSRYFDDLPRLALVDAALSARLEGGDFGR